MFYSTENVVDSMCFAIRIAAVTTDAAFCRWLLLLFVVDRRNVPAESWIGPLMLALAANFHVQIDRYDRYDFD